MFIEGKITNADATNLVVALGIGEFSYGFSLDIYEIGNVPNLFL